MPIPEMGTILLLGLCFLIIASAFWVVMSPNLVHSAVSLLFTLFGVAGLYIFLYADFIAATQVIIYVGGILVLIIFGVMLTNKIEDLKASNPMRNKIPGILFSIGFLFLQFKVIFYTEWNISEELITKDETTAAIGELILTDYLLPFEVASIILLAALVGAALLSRKKVEQDLQGQEVNN